jgi:hypothetical protein
MKTDCFVRGALPSEGKMECHRLAKPAYLEIAMAHAIWLDLDNSAMDHAMAERYQAIFNRDIATDTSSKVSRLSLLKGGKKSQKVRVQNRDKPLLQSSTEQPNHFRRARRHQQDIRQKA